jgi:hypothetical protein
MLPPAAIPRRVENTLAHHDGALDARCCKEIGLIAFTRR